MNATTTRCLMFRKHIAGPIVLAAVAIIFMAAHTSAAPGTATRPRFKAVAFEELGVRPDRVVTNLNGLLEFALSTPSAK
jgi:hypothetical protein